MQPDFQAHPQLGFPRGGDTGRKLLAVAVEGRFDSAFAGRPSPLLTARDEPSDAADAEAPEAPVDEPADPVVSAVIERSPSSARERWGSSSAASGAGWGRG